MRVHVYAVVTSYVYTHAVVASCVCCGRNTAASSFFVAQLLHGGPHGRQLRPPCLRHLPRNLYVCCWCAVVLACSPACWHCRCMHQHTCGTGTSTHPHGHVSTPARVPPCPPGTLSPPTHTHTHSTHPHTHTPTHTPHPPVPARPRDALLAAGNTWLGIQSALSRHWALHTDPCRERGVRPTGVLRPALASGLRAPGLGRHSAGPRCNDVMEPSGLVDHAWCHLEVLLVAWPRRARLSPRHAHPGAAARVRPRWFVFQPRAAWLNS